MNTKIKLLMVGDAGRPTGFEKVVRGVAEYLHSTGKYDIVVRGLGYNRDTAIRGYTMPVLPASTDPSDPNGVDALPLWVAEHKPHVLWMLNDLWNIAGYVSTKPAHLRAVAYAPVDAPNVQWGNAHALAGVSEMVAYTNFGAVEMARGVRDAVDLYSSVLASRRSEPAEWFDTQHYTGGRMVGRMDRLERYQNPQNFNRVPHGLEKDVFTPMDKAECRRGWGIPEGVFVVSNVGTNQFRKRLDLTYRAFAAFAKNKPDVRLLIHTQGRARYQGWNLGQMARFYGITSKVVYTDSHRPTVSDWEMAELYNCADVNINTSGGEGWGLCSMESAACGVPQVVPNWSGTRELWQNAALLTEIEDYRLETKYTNVAYGDISVAHLIEQLELLYQDHGQRKVVAERCKSVADQQVTWPDVGKAFDQIIENALDEPAPRAVSYDDIVAARTELPASDLDRFTP